MSGYTKMETRSNSQVLVSLMLLSVLCSQTLALPLETYSTMSRMGNSMLFDGPNELEQNLGLLKVKNDDLESSLPENDLSFGDAPRPLNRNRRHGEGTFTSDVSIAMEAKTANEFIKSLIGSLSCLHGRKHEKCRSLPKREADPMLDNPETREQPKEAMKKYLKDILDPNNRILTRNL